MDPARKRKLRFVIALTCALLLASALVYTSFSASSEARSPSQLAASAQPGQVYELTGKVREGHGSVPVSYTGALPDPFRDGREIIVDVRKRGSTFVGERDSLVTKCPSKFTAEKKNA